ncbi:MAG: nucleotide exchange factor GrpE [Candidatus Limivicinus sp.]|nr:nucleotide exchange factor GrpE [Clostridiales bacterium]MDY6131866.1 nucleotide exchange factor GrpE [Candidatus Limivicinus sp.]
MSEDKKTQDPQQEPELKEEAGAEAKKAEEKPSGKKQDKKESKGAGEKKEEQSSPAEELKGANDRYLRLLAEYDNYRKRSQKEKDSLYADIKSDTVAKFLPVYDNLVRALAQSTEDEAYRRGVEMIMTQFNTTLEKLGATKIECLGQKFDPSLHNAVMHVEDEEKSENEIVEVFQEGFMMGEKVIRFAMVKVAN